MKTRRQFTREFKLEAVKLDRARETENPQNRLSEGTHGEWLDIRAQSAASGADPEMATVGTIDGAANARGKGDG